MIYTNVCKNIKTEIRKFKTTELILKLHLTREMVITAVA